METYVVRVYRKKDEQGNEILGMVEDVAGGDKKPFTTVDEMVNFLTGVGEVQGPKKKVKRDPTGF